MNDPIHVFISYKRYGEWTKWVRGPFLNLLKTHLTPALGYEAKVFVDDQLEGGGDWPHELADKVARAHVMIPLFSKMYFSSHWCIREFYAARFKEDELGMRTSSNPSGLILPARIHDGLKNDLPLHLEDCSRITAEDLRPYALTSIREGSERYTNFEEQIRHWVEHSIYPAIKRAEALKVDPSWHTRIAAQDYPCPEPADFSKPTFPTLA